VHASQYLGRVLIIPERKMELGRPGKRPFDYLAPEQQHKPLLRFGQLYRFQLAP
jgi:hypothetical protein